MVPMCEMVPEISYSIFEIQIYGSRWSGVSQMRSEAVPRILIMLPVTCEAVLNLRSLAFHANAQLVMTAPQ
jgi:hypothetical protein